MVITVTTSLNMFPRMYWHIKQDRASVTQLRLHLPSNDKRRWLHRYGIRKLRKRIQRHAPQQSINPSQGTPNQREPSPILPVWWVQFTRSIESVLSRKVRFFTTSTPVLCVPKSIIPNSNLSVPNRARRTELFELEFLAPAPHSHSGLRHQQA